MSFIENVNTIANATKLSTGDVVEDVGLARDETVTAKEVATAASEAAQRSETAAFDWAAKGFNNPVDFSGTNGDPRYSAYHWAVAAENTLGDPILNDGVLSTNYVWSSTKVDSLLNSKANVDHQHVGVYEPVFTKNSAFNKNFGGSGSDYGNTEGIARADHKHDLMYMPLAPTNTGYNKNFGTSSGTVAEGDHTHSSLYMPLVTQNSAYNKSFVVNANAPLSTEVARGNHTHNATGISYDSSTSSIVTSTTAQGAIAQLDAYSSNISAAEKCNIGAGMTNPTYTLPIGTATVGEKIITAMTVSPGSKNAIMSGGDLTINYATAPDKLVAGWLSATVTIEVLANKEYGMAIWADGVIIDDAFRTQLGSADKAATGTFAMSLDGYISGVPNGTKLSVALYNMTDTTDITVLAHTISFAGEPEGSLVISGTTVTHDDILGKDAVGQHPLESIYETGSSRDLVALLGDKADKVDTPVLDNVLAMDASGNIKDSGISTTTVNNSMVKIATPTLDNIVVMDSQGQAKDGGSTLATLAVKNGNASETFSVADATSSAHAVSKGQLDALSAIYAPTVHTHTIANVTNLQATLDGKALSSHTHAQTDIVGLTDALDTKYNKVALQPQDGLPSFDTNGQLKDSGIITSNVVLNTNLITTSAGAADASKAVKLDASGKFDVSLLPAVANITDHTDLTSIGVNTHAQIDTHITNNTIGSY